VIAVRRVAFSFPVPVVALLPSIFFEAATRSSMSRVRLRLEGLDEVRLRFDLVLGVAHPGLLLVTATDTRAKSGFSGSFASGLVSFAIVASLFVYQAVLMCVMSRALYQHNVRATMNSPQRDASIKNKSGRFPIRWVAGKDGASCWAEPNVRII
jgi:hypothetical protein